MSCYCRGIKMLSYPFMFPPHVMGRIKLGLSITNWKISSIANGKVIPDDQRKFILQIALHLFKM